MPIYAYKCSACGHAKDVLQKISDTPLTVCPTCNAAAFSKQITAAGFQLKGSGWYVSDFRGSGDGANSGVGKEQSGSSTSTSSSSAASPAPATSAAPAATPSPAPSPAPAAASPAPNPAPAST